MAAELIAQLVDPAHATLAAHSNTKVQWRCSVDPRHVWESTPKTRKRSPGCPVCLNKVILPGVNDLATTDPELASELRQADQAHTTHRGAHAKLDWICTSDASHQWSASVVSRTRLGAGCPYCSGRLPVPGLNDLATTHPDLALTLVNPEEARSVGAGSAKKLLWRCTEDPSHTWLAPVRNKSATGRAKATGCPHCLKRGKRSATRHLTLAELSSPVLADAVDPEFVGTLSAGSGKVVAWHCRECAAGHVFTMSVRHRMRGQGCPIKAGTQILVGVNDLATTHPQLAAQLVDPTLATSLSRGGTIPVQWRCEHGHLWSTPTYARVANNGCPHCSPIGSSYGEQEMLAVLRVLDPSTKHRAKVATAHGKSVEVDAIAGTIAFEFNGVFWHSEAMGRDHNSHATKLKALRAAGLSLITVWEDDWADLNRRAVLVRTFAYKLNRLDNLFAALAAAGLDNHADPQLIERVGARTLRVVELSGAKAAEFYRQNHVQGAVTLTRSFALCDTHGHERAVLGLRSPRHNARARREAGYWEIQRYATRGVIPGGFSKLLSHALRVLIAEGEPLLGWVTFSANEWSEGQLYAASGFTEDGTVRPSYWYAGGPLRGQRQPKEAFQLKRFRSDEALIYEEGWTERQAASANKLYRVYDAGKTRWVKHRSL